MSALARVVRGRMLLLLGGFAHSRADNGKHYQGQAAADPGNRTQECQFKNLNEQRLCSKD
jgi:hypothetical protein